VNKEEITEALLLEDFSLMYEEADHIRLVNKGDDVFIRAIIEFSNVCARKCFYCGINAANNKVNRYRMSYREITETAEAGIKAGYRTVVLQSGEVRDEDPEWLGQIIKKIKKHDGVAVTLSVGEQDHDVLKYYRDCGADRYLLKHETADPELYGKLHPDGTLEERIRCLRDIKALGYETGSGFMTGLPGQTTESIADDILLLKELECDMAGIGPFIPHPDTPLAGTSHGDPEITRRAVALARIILPEANLPVTTALGVLDPNERRKAFSCGANVIMKKITPDIYKKDYCIYPAVFGRTEIEKDRIELEKLIEETDRRPI